MRASPLFLGLAAVALAALAVVAARRSPSPKHVSIDVGIAGCADVLSAGAAITCVLDAKRSMRIAIRGNGESTRVLAMRDGGRAASPERVTERQDRGALLRLVIPPGAREVVVIDGPEVARVRVADGPVRPRIDAANRARNEGRLDDAKREAEAALASADAAERALGHGVLGRLALRAGDLERAQTHLKEGIAAHAASGHLGAETEDTFALAFLLSQRMRRLTEARALLDALAPRLAGWAEGAARLPMYRANIAIAIGDARGALEDSRRARAQAARLGLRGTERRARLGEAHHLATIGDLDVARALLDSHRRVLDAAIDATACEKAEHASEVADLERLAHRPDAEIRAAERVLALTERDCPDAIMRTVALGTLAAAAADQRRLGQARELLGRARTATREPRVQERLVWEEIEGRIALADGRLDDALGAFARTRALAEQASLAAPAWLASIGRGRAFEARGDLDAAEAAYRDAEATLGKHAIEIPLGEGRGLLLAGKSESAGRLVDLLVRRGKSREALDVVRVARARELAAASRASRIHRQPAFQAAMTRFATERQAIEEDVARDWSRTNDERVAHARTRRERAAAARAALDNALSTADALPEGGPRLRAIGDGEVVLATMTTPTATHAFVASAAEIRTFRVELGLPHDRETWAKRLLAPAEEMIAAAKRVSVFTTGAVRNVPVFALPFRGAPLLAKVLVVSPLDLEVVVREVERERPALVVSDPAGDLAGAHLEGEEAARALGTTPLAGARATLAAVRPALEAAGSFHFAGHASFAGGDGVESGLVLADGTRLEVGDVLGLGRVPARVVLDACEAGRTDTRSVGHGWGVAQAFVAHGSAIVIAPTRTIPDRAGLVMARALYPRFGRATHEEALEIARAALLATAASAPDDWDAFVLFVP